jgi:hypothetical protein
VSNEIVRLLTFFFSEEKAAPHKKKVTGINMWHSVEKVPTLQVCSMVTLTIQVAIDTN